jgi:hypothetical protein
MYLEHKLYEPAFYSTVINDWGTSYVCAKELGPKCFCLVDLGHHAPNVNIEMIVARLIQLGSSAASTSTTASTATTISTRLDQAVPALPRTSDELCVRLTREGGRRRARLPPSTSSHNGDRSLSSR